MAIKQHQYIQIRHYRKDKQEYEVLLETPGFWDQYKKIRLIVTKSMETLAGFVKYYGTMHTKFDDRETHEKIKLHLKESHPDDDIQL